MTVYDKQMTFSDVNDEYSQFVDKFNPKKTTDDCYTPDNIYNAVVDWACRKYEIGRDSIVRPFWPGGDYERFDYPDGCAVVDNPPFSILSRIIRFYCSKNVKFLLFGPALTLFSAQDMKVTYIVSDSTITYANGAVVQTGFITNMGTLENVIETSTELHAIIKQINKLNVKKDKKAVRKLALPDCIVTAARMQHLVSHGIDMNVRRAECVRCNELDNLKGGIFGGGYMLSERAAAERAAAERAAAERAAAERDVMVELSQREIEFQKSIGGEI